MTQSDTPSEPIGLLDGADGLPPALVEILREIDAWPGCGIITDREDGRIHLRRGDGMTVAQAKAILERLRPYAGDVFDHIDRLGELRAAREGLPVKTPPTISPDRLAEIEADMAAGFLTEGRRRALADAIEALVRFTADEWDLAERLHRAFGLPELAMYWDDEGWEWFPSGRMLTADEAKAALRRRS